MRDNQIDVSDQHLGILRLVTRVFQHFCRRQESRGLRQCSRLHSETPRPAQRADWQAENGACGKVRHVNHAHWYASAASCSGGCACRHAARPEQHTTSPRRLHCCSSRFQPGRRHLFWSGTRESRSCCHDFNNNVKATRPGRFEQTVFRGRHCCGCEHEGRQTNTAERRPSSRHGRESSARRPSRWG